MSAATYITIIQVLQEKWNDCNMQLSLFTYA